MQRKSASLLFSVLLLAMLQSCMVYQEVWLDDENRTAYDAVIVPGFPFDSEEGRLNPFQHMRLFWAYHLYVTGETKNIIVSGGAVHTPYVEAEVFALYLKELGVNPRHIIIENKAEHSTENVFYSLELAKHHGFEKVALATDPMQSRMISYLMRDSDVEIDYLPADLRTLGMKYWKRFHTRVEGSSAYVSNFVPLKEREDRKQRMKGTRGEKYLQKMQEEQDATSVSVVY